MSQTITMTLCPEADQVQVLLDTMRTYSELCNYISKVVHERGQIRPGSLYYWKIDLKYQNFYDEVRDIFPSLNSNWIPLAFRKVAKSYKKKMPCNAHQFNDILDYSTYLLTIKLILPPPSTIGMLSMSTLGGRHLMHFLFDEAQRKGLKLAFSSKVFREYKLKYRGDTFILSTIIKDQPERLDSRKKTCLL